MRMRRVFLKPSGEALTDPRKTRLDEGTVRGVARQVRLSADAGIQMEIVIGGGNFQRGRISEAADRTKTDQIGMPATIINCIYASEILGSAGVTTQILTPSARSSMTKLFSKDRTNKYFERDMIVFFTGGTGHSCSSTDTGVVLGAIEVGADCILLAKVIDRVYDNDPRLNPEVRKYDAIPIQGVIDKQLVVVDLTMSIMCMERRMPIVAFSLNEKNGIADAIQGRANGTVITA